ncbi:methyl-accepting chemotaxis protein [Ramlibacter humi]|uniref:methyl-accepting chemotaxis protein n=1 Tax=Ramlibacter humi TaxID=2530451 RepID=UPI0030840751
MTPHPTFPAASARFLLSPALRMLRAIALPAKLALLGALFAGGAAALAFGLLARGTPAAVLFTLGGLALLAWAWLAVAFCIGFIGGLRALVARMDDVAQGRLLAMVPPAGRDEIAQLGQTLARMTTGLSAVVCEVRSNAALVEEAGRRLAADCEALSGRTERQAANVQETSAGIRQLAGTVDTNAQNASLADAESGRVRGLAEGGGRSMQEAMHKVRAIQQDAHRMGEMVSVIDHISFQTNLLALNAAVEAARAGEQGRGFAVVAAEVRRLATRSAEEAGRIRELIGSSTRGVDQGAQVIGGAGQGMAQVLEGVREVAARMSSISAASREQSQGLAELAQAIEQLDGITRENAGMVEETSRHALSLKGRSAALSSAVAHFTLPQGTAGEALALVESARAAAQGRGADEFARLITDPRQPFHDRDMYVFALDAQGCYRAFGGNPGKVGSRVQDLPGVRGAHLLDAIVAQAEREPGWVEYDIQNPVTGIVQRKMSYVLKLGALYLGCGVYQRLANA